MTPRIVYVKLGGSLITNKYRERTPRRKVIRRLAGEIAQGLNKSPQTRLLIGHGAGSFGHIQASHYNTRTGVDSPSDWKGFVSVATTVAELNNIVATELLSVGLPVFKVRPSASAQCQDGKLLHMAVEPISNAIKHGLIPLLHGDVAFDKTIGGTIISTEMILSFLAHSLPPKKVLLAGIAPGVLKEHPDGSVIPEITPTTFASHTAYTSISDAPDVTGGMKAKVAEMLSLVQNTPAATAHIFSAETEGALARAIDGTESTGTIIRADHQKTAV